jgi:hypothetical protein
MTQRMAPPEQSPVDCVPIGRGQPNLSGVFHRGSGQVRDPDVLRSVELAFTFALDRLGRHEFPVPILGATEPRP